MSIWLGAAAAALLAAAAQYFWREPGTHRLRLPAALLRAAALTLILALLFDAPAGPRRALRPFVALDASLSWLRGDADSTDASSTWQQALTAARGAGGDSLFLFGDSVRRAPASPTAGDNASSARPVVERALAAGRSLLIFTDGELDDPDALEALPRGSRVTVIPQAPLPDAALLSLGVPRAVVTDDTLTATATLLAGAAGAGAGTARLFVGERQIGQGSWDALDAGAEIALTLQGRVTAAQGPAVVRVVLESANDAEPRNDTLGSPLDVSRAAAAVLVSTAPDYDARYALVVLRGALGLPARAYFRVAPGAWRVDGTLAPVAEELVRAALRDAPIAIIHGDSMVFGPPRSATRGSLALLAPPSGGTSEWYGVSAPPSPLAASLAGVLWDSLPPIDVAASLPDGDWIGLETARARRLDRRPAIVGIERPRRTVVVGASGLWRWQFRGGASADAYAALWGSIFDWLAAERRDVRAAVPADENLRAGERLRWRRGGDDSVVTVVLSRRGAPPRVDTVSLRFSGGASIARSDPLPPGIYDAAMTGGSAVVVVNPSREWLPRPVRVETGGVGGGAVAGTAPRLRDLPWVFGLAIALLCAEWLVRRRAGLR